MAHKAGTTSTTSEQALPLDGFRWVPLAEVFARLRPRLGGQGPAEHDLSMVLAEGRLRCLNRYRTPQGVWARKLVSLLCWLGREVQYWSSGKFTTRRQQNWSCPKSWSDPRLSFHLCDRGIGFSQPGFGDGILYAWLPDLEQIWPTVFSPAIPPEKQEEPVPEPSSPKSDPHPEAPLLPPDPQPKSPESARVSAPQLAKRLTLKSWVPDALRDHPPPKNTKDVAGYLLQFAPKPWKKHSIQNLLPKNQKSKKG